jgi:hypothetical protein
MPVTNRSINEKGKGRGVIGIGRIFDHSGDDLVPFRGIRHIICTCGHTRLPYSNTVGVDCQGRDSIGL